MKVATAAHEIRASGIGQSQAFTLDMKDPSKLFDVLINYTNPIGAVVREYACNCLDIHQQTGQTRPFIVAAPSAAEPMLRFRDFGTGLNDELVKTLYCSFLNSTKDGSNDQVGGFGLGSKSGFAYADMFTVTSWQNGWKSVFSVYRGSDRVPRIALAERVECGDPTGFEVSIPIKPQDFHRVTTEMQDKLQWFPEGSYEAVGCSIEPYRPVLAGQGWSTKAQLKTSSWWGNYTYQHRKPRVKMGPVVYDVNWELVGDIIKVDDLIIEVPIGSVSLPFTREHISLDDGTIEVLKQRLAEVRADATSTHLKRVRDCATPWAVACVAYEVGYFIEAFDAGAETYKLGDFEIGLVGGQGLYRGSYKHKRTCVVQTCDYSDLDRVTAKWGYLDEKSQIRPINAVVIIDDVSATTSKPYLWPRLKANRHKIRPLVPTTAGGGEINILIIPDEKHLVSLGSPPANRVMKMSELTFQPTSSGRAVNTDPVVYTRKSDYGVSRWAQSRLSERATPTLYVPMKGADAEESDWHDFVAVPWVRDSTHRWVGLPKRAQEELGEDCPPSVKEYVLDRAAKLLAEPTFDEAYRNFVLLERIRHLSYIDTLLDIAGACEDPLLVAFADEIQNVRSARLILPVEDIASLRQLASKEHIKLPPKPGEQRFEVLHKRILEKRPVFKFILENCSSVRIREDKNLPVILKSLEVRTR